MSADNFGKSSTRDWENMLSNLDKKKKQLIIVTDEKNESYAQLLAAMVATDDDEKGEGNEMGRIVGVKDGSVQATIWKEKHYRDTQPTITSNLFLTYIGDNPTTMKVASSVKFESELEHFGIKIGTLGNNAVIFCEKKALHKQSTYDAFFEEYQRITEGLRVEYGNINSMEKSKNVGESINAGVNTALEKSFTGVVKLSKKVLGKNRETNEEDAEETVHVQIPKWVTSTLTGVATTLVAWPIGLASMIAMGVKKTKSNAEREKQQMAFSILWFYLNRLNSFMRMPDNG